MASRRPRILHRSCPLARPKWLRPDRCRRSPPATRGRRDSGRGRPRSHHGGGRLPRRRTRKKLRTSDESAAVAQSDVLDLRSTGARLAMTESTRLGCACGQVQLKVERAPTVVAECHCASCRAAGARLEARPASPPFRETNGGTRFVLYRKDRVHFVGGAERLGELRLTPAAKTRRVVATCCNTAVASSSRTGTGSASMDVFGRITGCLRSSSAR